MCHQGQEDSGSGAESQVAGTYTRYHHKPQTQSTPGFYKPSPCANPQLKIVQGKALQETGLMSRLGLKTISFKAPHPK